MRIAEALVTCLVLAALPLSARTIALWPLNWDVGNNRPDGGCALDGANNLTVNPNVKFAQDTTGIGWTLPPNLEPRNWRFPATRTDAPCATNALQAGYVFANAHLGCNYATVTNDFTLEGWIRLPAIPAAGKFFWIASDCENSPQRWFLSLRHRTQGVLTWEIYSQAENIPDTALLTLDTGQVEALTNGWHHFALTHQRRASDAIWRFYQDGTLLGSKAGTKYSDAFGTSGSRRLLCLGGRDMSTEDERILRGSFSYWRLSDKALGPEGFLNAADVHRTVALWKLDRDASGGICGAPSVGTAHLTGGFVLCRDREANLYYSKCRFYPDSDCAFTGNPPNTTVELPNGNAGSLFSRNCTSLSRLAIHRIGSDLSLTNDFTVEGWIKLECRDSEHSNVKNSFVNRHVCGTRANRIGWVLQVRRERGARRLILFVQDDPDTSGNVLGETVMGDISAYERKWVHLAIAYDHDGGDGATGVWNCYVDGTLTGSATNAVAPSNGALEDDSQLIFGSQAAAANLVLSAKYDCWRVSRAALQPAQLMCATNGAAATDVLALWPMNAQNGIGVDGTDVVGSYTFEDSLPARCLATAVDDAPDVPGISTAGNGSARFRSGDDGKRSYLICNDETVAATIANTGGYTFETYLYRTEQLTGNDYDFILLTSKGNLGVATGNSIGDLYLNLSYRAWGFQLYDRGVINPDQKFVDGGGQNIMLPLNKWTHLALTYRIENGNGIFDLYLDGIKKGTLSHAVGTQYTPQVMFIGGRYISDSSWRGKMSTVRISKGCLSSNEFLCARSATPESLAYWPLDGVPALDLTGRIQIDDGSFGGTLNSFTAWSDVTGLSGALSRVPRPDTSTNFVGNAFANAGAVQLAAGGYAQTQEAGTYVDLDGSFTAEGWIRWARSQGAAVETVCGTYAYGKGGWKLVLDSTGGTPTMRIHAEGEGPVCVLADGVLMADASPLEGAWHHLALRYDAAAGDGVWSLLVDGEVTGSVTNAWRPSGIFDRAEFRLGAFGGDTTFAGGYDVWRISRGVRSADDILWMPPKGTLMFVR